MFIAEIADRRENGILKAQMVYVMWDCYLQGAEENHKQSISVFKDEPIMPLLYIKEQERVRGLYVV